MTPVRRRGRVSTDWSHGASWPTAPAPTGYRAVAWVTHCETPLGASSLASTARRLASAAHRRARSPATGRPACPPTAGSRGPTRAFSSSAWRRSCLNPTPSAIRKRKPTATPTIGLGGLQHHRERDRLGGADAVGGRQRHDRRGLEHEQVARQHRERLGERDRHEQQAGAAPADLLEPEGDQREVDARPTGRPSRAGWRRRRGSSGAGRAARGGSRGRRPRAAPAPASRAPRAGRCAASPAPGGRGSRAAPPPRSPGSRPRARWRRPRRTRAAAGRGRSPPPARPRRWWRRGSRRPPCRAGWWWAGARRGAPGAAAAAAPSRSRPGARPSTVLKRKPTKSGLRMSRKRVFWRRLGQRVDHPLPREPLPADRERSWPAPPRRGSPTT